jgi:hypothetical protein
MERLPLAERSLLDTPALSWRPGQTPTHEASWAADGNAAACGPTSAMICWAESIPNPGNSAKRTTGPRSFSLSFPFGIRSNPNAPNRATEAHGGSVAESRSRCP